MYFVTVLYPVLPHLLQLGVDLPPLGPGLGQGQEARHDGGRDDLVRAGVYPLHRVAASQRRSYIYCYFETMGGYCQQMGNYFGQTDA